jgi:predicted transposase YbfD/YdcC
MTTDAIGCQTEIAEKIIELDSDDVLSLKENQGQLYEDVAKMFADLEDSQYKAYTFDYEKTVNKDHGRIEIREC